MATGRIEADLRDSPLGHRLGPFLISTVSPKHSVGSSIELRPSSCCGREGGKGEREGEKRGEGGREERRGREGRQAGTQNAGVTMEQLRPEECSRALSAMCSSSWGRQARGVCRGQAAPAKGKRQMEPPGKPGRCRPESEPEQDGHK